MSFSGFISISLASWKFSRIVFDRLSHSSLRLRWVKSVFNSFSKRASRPKPGGAMLIPFGFSRRKRLFAISSMEGMLASLSADMKTIMFLRPLRYSGR